MKSVSPVLHNSPSIYIPVQKMQGLALPSVNIGDNCLASSLLGFPSHHHVDTAMFFLSTVSRRPVVAGSLVPRPRVLFSESEVKRFCPVGTICGWVACVAVYITGVIARWVNQLLQFGCFQFTEQG